MDQDFRKKTFRGAKIEDVILELKKLISLCETKSSKSEDKEQQRFYEGMAIAYTTVQLKLQGEFDYIEEKVIHELGNVMKRTTLNDKAGPNYQAIEECSFCRRSKKEVGELALGPGVSICRECLQFGVKVIEAQKGSTT
ncbi:ClpX C4-type zinc finger protein [Alkalihalobacillus sp. 1P02AB]|uniref:ClpX C4-type zinc finger protein n=1 Tax=Alkalihalobacillus sp. 1P02AB TaxID=3132260 RepID=UPI0039A56604